MAANASSLGADRPLSRRAWFAAIASGAGLLAAACSAGGSQVLDTPDGQVLQYEGDDLLILVSGLQKSYQVGDQMNLNLLVNNQSAGFVQIKLRTKVLGRGDQPVVQPEPVMLEVKTDDASSQDQSFVLPRDLAPGDYALSVEVPPWKLDGRETGVGATLRAPVRLDPAASQ
ncbi:MAG: hypothetical protein JOZ87_22290 [Chloroflexi bacterium]|nr:hypothetical protein [Chloroflexota bacterium]